MDKQVSFREIFMAHLSQNEAFSEEKLSNFDPTLYETAPFPSRKFHFKRKIGENLYRQEGQKFSNGTSSSRNTPKDDLKKTPQPPVNQPIVEEASLYILTMKDLKTPEQLAAASIVTSYLGDKGFLPRTEIQMKKAYRKMLLKEHPDQGGNSDTLSYMIEAFRILLTVFEKQRLNK